MNTRPVYMDENKVKFRAHNPDPSPGEDIPPGTPEPMPEDPVPNPVDDPNPGENPNIPPVYKLNSIQLGAQ